jgi:hypothetical protein
MTDVENTFRVELDRMLVVDATPDWEGVLASTRDGGEDARGRRLGIAVAVLVATAAVALVTPLGGAIARGLEDFTTWLTGDPGTPVSEEEQRAFEEDNAHSWLGFPEGTELRRLVTRTVGDSKVELFGFRPGASRLCLRVVVTGALREKTLECAPLEELRREGGPVRVLIADEGVGQSDKTAWYGVHRVHSNQLKITAGIAADNVSAVVLRDDAARHEVPVESNAFLYVAEEPEVGVIIREVEARTPGGLVAVPFAPAPYVFAATGGLAPAPPAPKVEREVSEGRIGWLEEGEPRGEPIDELPEPRGGRLRLFDHVVFGRVLTLDPDRPDRLMVALTADRAGGEVTALCTWRLVRSVGGGGCAPYPGVLERRPVTFGMAGGGPGAFVTVDGYASDDVERLEAVLADGQQVEIPLTDNFYIVDLPRAKLPALVIGYDSDDRVVSVSEPVRDFSVDASPGGSPARGKAELLWRVESPDGSSAELSVGPATAGGECRFLKTFVDDRHTGVTTSCSPPGWTGAPVQLRVGWSPGRFVNGRVRDDVKAVRIRFGDGESVSVEPRRGYVLYAMPAEHLTEGRLPIAADGLDASGNVVGTASFPPFPPPRGG